MSTSELARPAAPEPEPGPSRPGLDGPTETVGTTPLGAPAGQPTTYAGAGGPAAFLRFQRSELRLIFRRRRNLALLGVLSLAPILLGIAVRVSAPSNGDGPAFIGDITENGLFLAFTSLVVTLPLFLPLTVSVVAGESIAGEAATGSLRNLLVVPGRTDPPARREVPRHRGVRRRGRGHGLRGRHRGRPGPVSARTGHPALRQRHLRRLGSWRARCWSPVTSPRCCSGSRRSGCSSRR